MQFSDGVNIPTAGKLRTYRAKDGWYVVGEGTMVPCSDEADARATLTLLQASSQNEKELQK